MSEKLTPNVDAATDPVDVSGLEWPVKEINKLHTALVASGKRIVLDGRQRVVGVDGVPFIVNYGMDVGMYDNSSPLAYLHLRVDNATYRVTASNSEMPGVTRRVEAHVYEDVEPAERAQVVGAVLTITAAACENDVITGDLIWPQEPID